MGRAKNKKNKVDIGDFTFEGSVDYEKYKQHKDEAMELICRHFEFYEQLNSPSIEYVTRGAKLSCTHGNKYIYLDAAKDHGIYDGDDPVLTCRDCKVNENIYDFGACGNGKFEPLYSDEAPHPAMTTLNKNGQERYVCLPVLLGEWGYGDISSRSLLIGEVFIDKMYKVYQKESPEDTSGQTAQDQSQNSAEDAEDMDAEYSQALMTCDNLLCLYGGVITIEENPEPKDMEEVPDMEEDTGQDNIVERDLYEVDPSDAESVKKYMWNFFVDKGFEEIQVAGILGNVQQECNFVPDKKNIYNDNYGLFQLDSGRQKRYENWIATEGLPKEEIVQNQCKFAIEEYDNPAGTGWLNRGIKTEGSIVYNGQTINYDVTSDGSQEDFIAADNPIEAALIWGISFERCFDSKSQDGYYSRIQEQEERVKYALEVYDNREVLYYDE